MYTEWHSTHSEQRDQSMHRVVAYGRLKTRTKKKIIKPSAPTSGRGLLQVAIAVYERFQQKCFDWVTFGVLEWWSLMRGGCTLRFDCIFITDRPSKKC